jgi:TRAP-type C4-dicarboxylate transport system substrate-binding protein
MVKIEGEDAPLPALTTKKLKEVVRKYVKTEAIPDETLEQINSYLATNYHPK